MSKILGIDYGSVRIGIAMSDESGTIAFSKEVLDGNSPAAKKILKMVCDESVSKVVVGYPLNLKGAKTKQTEEVDTFIKQLESVLPSGTKIIKWDERLTSKMAASFMVDSGMKKKKRQEKSNLDLLSAAFILQSYLDSKKYSPDL